MRNLKRLNVVFEKLGFKVTRPAPPIPDLSADAETVVEAVYKAKGRPFIYTVPLSDCRQFSFQLNENNPFVKALVEYSDKKITSYDNSPLNAFYNEWQPKTLAEEKGINPEEANEFLLNVPQYCSINPWGDGFKSDYYKLRLNRKGFKEIEKENKWKIADVEGCIYFGPVSTAFGEITLTRLIKIYDSIKNKGFQPHRFGGYIHANIFIRNNEARIILISGRHRIAAIAALGIKEVPVLFGESPHPLIVRRQDVHFWPNVKNGYFTPEQAMAIFDRQFDGRHPWLDNKVYTKKKSEHTIDR